VPVPPKPAEAAAEFNRPQRDQRAKLVEIVEMGIGNNTIPIWQDGGKRLLLVSEGRGSSAPRKTVTVAGVELVNGFGTSYSFLGLTGKGEQWVEYVAKGAGINAYHRLVTREFRGGADPFAKTLETTDFDHAADGYPVAVTPDGKTVFTLGFKVVEPAAPGKDDKRAFFFRALDGGSGEPQRTVAKIDGDEEYLSFAFAPSRDRLYVLLRTQNAVVMRAVATATGKAIWDRNFDGFPGRSAGQRFALTDNGDTLAVAVPLYTELPVQPPPGGRVGPGFPGGWGPGGGGVSRSLAARVHILDAATGKDRVELAGQGTGINQLYAISPDGRLVAGMVRNKHLNGSSGRIGEVVSLAVWDTKSGKVLKTWDHTFQSWDLFVTFAPNRPLMVLSQPGADEKQSGTLGFWDLSGLLK